MQKRQFVILLVDDSLYALKALKRTLVPEGYTIFTADSAQNALKVLGAEPIDLVITDEHMPGTSGTDLLKTVRTLYPDVIRIMLTGLTDIEVARNAINQGEIYRFFNKPWDDFELIAAVRQAAQLRTLEHHNSELRSKVEDQRNMLRKLEREFPGITDKNITEDGALVIEE